MRQSLFLCVVLAACTSTPEPRPSAPPTPTARPAAPTVAKLPTAPVSLQQLPLGIGDKVRIDVFGEPDLSMDQLIPATGAINYPLLGHIPAVGMTPKDLELRIARGLKGDYLVNPIVRVAVTEYRPVYVVGQVRRAGSFPYIEGLTIEKALALAGGMTELASERKIFVLRESTPGGVRLRAELQTPVFPGDTIIVEEALF